MRTKFDISMATSSFYIHKSLSCNLNCLFLETEVKRNLSKNLTRKLFDGYNKDFLPSLSESEPVKVRFEFELITIKEVVSSLFRRLYSSMSCYFITTLKSSGMTSSQQWKPKSNVQVWPSFDSAPLMTLKTKGIFQRLVTG